MARLMRCSRLNWAQAALDEVLRGFIRRWYWKVDPFGDKQHNTMQLTGIT